MTQCVLNLTDEALAEELQATLVPLHRTDPDIPLERELGERDG